MIFSKLRLSLRSHYPSALSKEQLSVWLLFLPCLVITIFSLLLAHVSSYLITFIAIVLLLFFSYVVIAIKRNVEQRIRTLSNLIESMIDGDYSLRGRLHHDHAFQEVLTLINNLADSLTRHKTQAKESRLLLEKIMEQMDAMVLAVDEQGVIVMANASAKKLIINQSVNDELDNILLADLPLGEKIVNSPAGIIDFSVAGKLRNHAKKGMTEKETDDENIQPLLSGEHFLFTERFLSEGKPHQLYFITNAERLLMEKERKAWQSLLRVLSHEVNNSLTPVAAISQSMIQQLSIEQSNVDRLSLLAGVNIINERANSLSTFIARYSQLSHLPQPHKSTFNLQPLLDHTMALFPQVKFSTRFVPDETINAESANQQNANQQSVKNLTDVTVVADKAQLGQVLINVCKNAVEAMAEQAEKIIEIVVQIKQKQLVIMIKDQGKGIANSENLFVPFYSTKPQGSGIGLALCRQIMFNHGGSIQLINRNQQQGAKALLFL